jgi:hypothetical protein
VNAFVRSTYFDRVATIERPEDLDALANRGAARALLVIPSDFAAQLRQGQTAEVQVVLDGGERQFGNHRSRLHQRGHR